MHIFLTLAIICLIDLMEWALWLSRSWEMEFLNPEGFELPPPPPPPMIPPNVVMLVAEEKPVELFANTSTPKLIPMARPDNGTKRAKDW